LIDTAHTNNKHYHTVVSDRVLYPYVKAADIRGKFGELPRSEVENFGKQDKTSSIDLAESDLEQVVRLLVRQNTSQCLAVKAHCISSG
jgi:hypothetical protein